MGISLKPRHRKWWVLIVCVIALLFLDTFLQYNVISSIFSDSDKGDSEKPKSREIHINSRQLREVEDMYFEKDLKAQIDLLTDRHNLSVFYTSEPVFRTDLSLKELFGPDRWQQFHGSINNQGDTGSSPRPILLNSYIRAGSSLLVDLVNAHKDTFYIPEPLWTVTPFGYFTADDHICSSKTGFCRALRRPNLDSSEQPDNEMQPLVHYAKRKEFPLDTSLRLLQNIFTCTYNKGFDTLPMADLPYSDLGHGLKGYIECEKDPSKSSCLNVLSDSCKEHRVRLAKVLRLTVSAVGNFLHINEHVKVVHLFRDPRAVIASRLYNADWYHLQTTTTITENARALCQKMSLDFRNGIRLMHLFPDRFMLARFEDFVSIDRNSHIKNFLRFLKIEPDVTKIDISRSSFGWRKRLTFDDMRLVDNECGEMYERLGYLKFKSAETLRNYEYNSFLSP